MASGCDPQFADGINREVMMGAELVAHRPVATPVPVACARVAHGGPDCDDD